MASIVVGIRVVIWCGVCVKYGYDDVHACVREGKALLGTKITVCVCEWGICAWCECVCMYVRGGFFFFSLCGCTKKTIFG